MTYKEALRLVGMSEQAIWQKGLEEKQQEAFKVLEDLLDNIEQMKKDLQEKGAEIKDYPHPGHAFSSQYIGFLEAYYIIDKYLPEDKNGSK